MNKFRSLMAVCVLVSISFCVCSNVHAASSESQQDQENTPVETQLLRKIAPGKLPMDSGSAVMTQKSPEKKSVSTNSLKSLPKMGSDTNFYGILGILILILVGVIRRYFIIKEG
ncbi:hypothetical protein AB1I58_07250 [Enterococcus hirae]|uniref:hypothetical protein n=1 Tax=Enterococcus hirae TaxID=1354 RepID=UPI001DFAF2B6|nr:hypothetical protein [Enterococcus hirae]